MITIQCDEIIVASMSLSDETCAKEDWDITWPSDVEKIRFNNKNPKDGLDDTEFYRAGTLCKL